jgi:oligopeptide transport system substrate-binding protein
VPLLLAGCGRGNFSERSARKSDSITWALRNDLKSLDPIRANEENTASVLGEVVETLVTVDPNGKIQPALAKSWTVDGAKVTFSLGDAKFSDGTPVTAKDVKASLERAMDAKLLPLETSTYLGDVSEVVATDDHTVTILLKTPSRTIVSKLSSPQVAIVPARFRNQAITKAEDLIGSGPYRMTDYRPSQRAVLEPNPNWRGGKAPIARIEVIPITDASSLLNRFRSGDVDLLQVASSDVGTIMDAKDLKERATLLPTTKVIYLLIQPAAYPPLKDPRVRRAIAMALDRKKLSEDLVRGEAHAAGRILPTGLAENKPLLPAYDPDAARKLLAEAGYPGGKGLPPLDFGFNEANRLNAIVDFLPTTLKAELGITVRTRPFGLSFMDEIQKHRLPMALSGWGAPYPDPQAVLSVLLRSDSATNYSGYSSAAFDAADTKAQISGKIEDFEAAEKIAANDVPILPLYSQPKVWLMSARLGGVVLSTYGSPDFSKAKL